ncbi:MAG: ComEA family DNA-binding protein [Candidatus Eremiobacteraeota bacterium]|nr:ComEA family DNA-binding protein [Candidatus Eremiobacteraeota bacterium]
MATRIALIVALAILVALAFAHPARPVITTAPALPAQTAMPWHSWSREDRRRPLRSQSGDAVVYVAGSVKRPGLYHVRETDRAAQAVAQAGGFTAAADPAGVNLAARAVDGDEIYVPVTGELRHTSSLHRRSSRHARATPPAGSVDVNHADEAELASVPGIGRSIAARVVALRQQEGGFASIDELLDVAGMTQSRLERARPYLRATGVAQPVP